jgi:acyl-CoA thioesterase FadM
MISVRTRIWLTLARWLLRERGLPPERVSRLQLRCWPWDLDMNFHMNNSRYLGLMDMGRWHLLLRTGTASEMWRRRWAPVAVRLEIDFRKSLAPFQRFTLESRTHAIGTRSCTVQQRFILPDGTVAAEALVVCLFRGKDGTVPLATVLEACPDLGLPVEEPAYEVTAMSSTT